MSASVVISAFRLSWLRVTVHERILEATCMCDDLTCVASARRHDDFICTRCNFLNAFYLSAAILIQKQTARLIVDRLVGPNIIN
jgi:hypothetical protein